MEAGALARAEKKAAEEERTIVFVDEASFCLLPMAVRTYSPCGQTPVLRVKLTHDHLIFDRSDHARWTEAFAEPRSCPTRADDVVRDLSPEARASFQASSWSSGMGHRSIGHRRLKRF